MRSPGITRTQNAAFWAAWLGWTFDGLDGFIYALVARPFVQELLGKGAGEKEVVGKAALIQAVFLIGWACGGAVFGRVGDRIGRSRTLTLTILLYAAFTGASFLAQTWWHLMIFRFFAALGIGGEWAAGSALVAETLPRRYAHWASALLQSGYICGMIGAAITVGALSHYPPRYVFLVGVIPALATLWIRRQVPETAEWHKERETKKVPPISDLFRQPVLRITLMTFGISAIALTSVWALLFFSTQVVLKTPEALLMSASDKAVLVRNVTIVYCLWNIAGNFFSAALARTIGYRWAFTFLFIGAFLTYILGFRQAGNLQHVTFWLDATFFFSSGVFALFPMYIPPLFPVLLRTTGSGLCYNLGRLTAAAGTIYGGYIASKAGGPHMAIFYAGFLYLPGVALTLFAPSLKHESEPGGAAGSGDFGVDHPQTQS
jgi:MFS family permease